MASAKKCIANMCKECIYDHTEPGSWRAQTEACTITSCPLYPVRPMTTASVAGNRKKRAITTNIIETTDITQDNI